MTFLAPNRIEELRQRYGVMSDPDSRDVSAMAEELQYLRRIAPVSISPAMLGAGSRPLVFEVVQKAWEDAYAAGAKP